MNEVEYRGLNFQTWFLIGMLTYIFAVLMIIYARYCLLKRTICPFSNVCLHCTCESKHCDDFVCQACKMEPILSKSFCCKQRHAINEPGCLTLLPTVKCQYFPPNCSYCYCLCCEVIIEDDYKTPQVINYVQNI